MSNLNEPGFRRFFQTTDADRNAPPLANGLRIAVIAIIGLLLLFPFFFGDEEPSSTQMTPMASAPRAADTTMQVEASGNGVVTGRISANPNPIVVCDGTGLGVTKIDWSSTVPGVFEIHIDSPDGPLFARGGETVSATTHKWVKDGMRFVVVDKGKRPVASVKVRVTRAGCP